MISVIQTHDAGMLGDKGLIMRSPTADTFLLYFSASKQQNNPRK